MSRMKLACLAAGFFAVAALEQTKADAQTTRPDSLTNLSKTEFIQIDSVALRNANDTSKPHVSTGHSVGKAVRYSAILPGLGQVYNKKAWKVPVIYGVFGVCTYFALDFHKDYRRYRAGYIARLEDPDAVLDDPTLNRLNVAQLQRGRDYSRRYRDLNYILIGVTYSLQILDASVDAYLFDFDVSDNLGMQLTPQPASLVSITWKL